MANHGPALPHAANMDDTAALVVIVVLMSQRFHEPQYFSLAAFISTETSHLDILPFRTVLVTWLPWLCRSQDGRGPTIVVTKLHDTPCFQNFLSRRL